MSWSRLAEHRRQGGIVAFLDADLAGEAGLRDLLHVVEHGVDVHAGEGLIGAHRERLHAIDELHDAVGLVADELRQHAIAVADLRLEQLRGAADAREWILDFVREHRGHRRHRPGGPRATRAGDRASRPSSAPRSITTRSVADGASELTKMSTRRSAPRRGRPRSTRCSLMAPPALADLLDERHQGGMGRAAARRETGAAPPRGWCRRIPPPPGWRSSPHCPRRRA